MPAAIVPLLGGATIGSIFANFIISFAISAIFQSLFAPDEPEAPEQEGPLVNKRGNTSSIPVIYGTRRVGGNRVFVATDGDNNKFLHLVLLVCEGEIEGFQDIYLDDSRLRFNGHTTGTSVFADNSTHSPIGSVGRDELGNPMNVDKYSGLVQATFHNGKENQAADSGLTSVEGWTSAHQLKGRAYVYLRFEYDQDEFAGIPSVTTDVKGKRVMLIDGSIGHSDNPALCFRDYLTNDFYGRGLDTALIDVPALAEAATYCESDINLMDAAGATLYTGPRYTMNGIVRTSETLYSNAQSILTNMRGFLVFSSGKYILKLDQAEMSQEHIYDESNIIGSLNVALGTKKNTLNRMRATYWNPNKNGEDDTVIVDEKLARDTLDNGVILSRELQLPYCDSPHRARYLLNQEIEQSRQQIHTTFTVGLAGLRNEVGDIIRMKHASMGWGYYEGLDADGENELTVEQPITINNIGQTGLVPVWTANVDYTIGDAVTFNGMVYVPITNPPQGVSPADASVWMEAMSFNDITNVERFGIIADSTGTLSINNNVGVGGTPLYKEFRILSLSLKENEEVELTCIEYDATVYDNMPLTIEDATPNTSFSNPNDIPAVDASSITFNEELYVTSTSGGVKSAVAFNWSQPNTPFIRSYDVFIHRPEEDWDVRSDYSVGNKVTHNSARWEAARISGPTSNETAVTITSSTVTVTAGTLISVGSVTYRANTDNAGLNINLTTLTPAVLGNIALWVPDDASGSVAPSASFAGTYWTLLTTVSDEDFRFQTSTTGREFTLLDTKPGIHDIRLRPNSVTGVRGAASTRNGVLVQGLVRPPSDITGFGLTLQGTLAQLTWDPATDLDVRIGGSIQVRHNPGVSTPEQFSALVLAEAVEAASSAFTSQQLALQKLWNNSAVLTEGKSGVTSQILVPLLQGTYMIKAIDASGIESLIPANIVNGIGNEIELFDITSISENPSWNGLTSDHDLINASSNVEFFNNTLRIATLAQWSPTAAYQAGNQVIYNGQIYQVRTNEAIASPPLGFANTTPEGDLISEWGLISQLGSISSAQWETATQNALTATDIPQFTSGTYYFNNAIILDEVESQEIAPILDFASVNIAGSIDNLESLIDDLVIDIDAYGRSDTAANTVVRLEISTTSNTDAVIPNDAWSAYTTFTEGSYNFRAARFRLAIDTSLAGTQVTVAKAGISTNLPARTLANTSNVSWTNAIAVGSDGFLDVNYQNTAGSQFHGGGISSNSGISRPDLSISVENIFPGEYFVVTSNNAPLTSAACTLASGAFTTDVTQPNTQNSCVNRGGTWDTGTETCSGAGTCAGYTTDLTGGIESAAPDPNEGFRIRFYRVRDVEVTIPGGGTTTVPGRPDPTTDGLLPMKTLNFDYRAQGY